MESKLIFWIKPRSIVIATARLPLSFPVSLSVYVKEWNEQENQREQRVISEDGVDWLT